MKMKKNKYTPEQLEFLRTGYARMAIRDLTPAFNAKFCQSKTRNQIQGTLSNHKILSGRKKSGRLMPCRLYTSEEAQFLHDNYKNISIAELTELFNLRFKKNMTTQQIRTFTHNRGIISGRTGRFAKGNKPWNTGTKGKTTENRTSFKKGYVPPNRKPLGSERIDCRDGYVLIKIAEPDPHTIFPTRYKSKHVNIWETTHGRKVPEGFVVAFKDNNKLNFAAANLILISRAELLWLNKHGYKEAPAELRESLLILSKLEVKTSKRLKHRE